MPFAWAKAEISLGAGLDTKGDIRAGRPPKLDIARDVSFGETGGVQARLTYIPFSNQIFGGGTLANCRRLAVVNDELCVFTDTALYSWNAQLTKWVLRGTHLAVAVDESPRFVTTGDQFDGDRAELNGTVVYAWTEGTVSFVSAIDKVTGSVLMSPTSISDTRCRLVALATKILLFAHDGVNNLVAFAIDPAAPALGGSVTVVAGASNLYYDVVRAGTQDLAVGACRRTVTTSYTAFTVTPGLAVFTGTYARTCDGPIAVATVTDGTQTQVIRGNGTNIQGDLLTTSTLASVFTGQAIGTAASATINQITVAYSSSTSARAFWTSGNIGETSGVTDFVVKSNTVTTSNAVGAQADFRHRLGIASRAFTYNGHAYVWLVFAADSGTSLTGNASAVRAQLQNTYFLYRDDNVIVSQATKNVAGGFAPSTGRLPGVALTDGSTGFAWCGTSRRRIELGTGDDHTAFAARSPRDIRFTFDSDEARRSAALGRTLYITGGIPLQYDGVQTAEVGFLNFPWYFEPQVGGAGNLAAGTYTWKATYHWTNAQGELERSTTATGMSLAVAASKFVFLNFVYLNTTLKTATRRTPTIEMWRTTAGAAQDAPFYLVTSQDPTALPGANNGYVINDDTLDSAGVPLPDNFADATLITKEANPENGAVLESLAPPPAKLIIANDTRVFLAGIAGDADAVWYSRLRNEGEIASFHDSLRALVPRPGGDITALAFNNETLTVFRESAIYALPGDGLNNLGQGTNYGPARVISLDVGAVSQESVALTPLGLVFKSSKGWYLLTPSWQLRYIGAMVNAFDADTVYAVHVLETEHHIRVVQSGRMLVWDYSAVSEESPLGQWGEWTVSSGIHAVMWRGQHIVLGATGPAAPNTSFASADFGIDIETTWLKIAETQGEFFLRAVAALGEYRSSHLLRIRLARDYQYDGAGNAVYFDDIAWTPSPTTVGSSLQVKHPPSINRMQALKVRLTAVTDAARALLICDLSGTMIVATDGLRWAAVLQAVYPGERGNIVALTITFRDGGAAPFSIDVRDHYSYATGRWAEALNTIGVLVTMTASSRPTVAQLEAAITAGTHLATIPTPDTPTKIIAASNIGTTRTALLSGGLYGAPTGEALKLTSLALEYGVSTGINKRLPASQKAA